MNGLLETKAAPAERAEAAILADDVLRFREDAMAVQLRCSALHPICSSSSTSSAGSSLPTNRPPPSWACSSRRKSSVCASGRRWTASTPMWNRAVAAPASSAASAALQGMMTSLSGRRAVRRMPHPRVLMATASTCRSRPRPSPWTGAPSPPCHHRHLPTRNGGACWSVSSFTTFSTPPAACSGSPALLTEATPEELDEIQAAGLHPVAQPGRRGSGAADAQRRRSRRTLGRTHAPELAQPALRTGGRLRKSP